MDTDRFYAETPLLPPLRIRRPRGALLAEHSRYRDMLADALALAGRDRTQALHNMRAVAVADRGDAAEFGMGLALGALHALSGST